MRNQHTRPGICTQCVSMFVGKIGTQWASASKSKKLSTIWFGSGLECSFWGVSIIPVLFAAPKFCLMRLVHLSQNCVLVLETKQLDGVGNLVWGEYWKTFDTYQVYFPLHPTKCALEIGTTTFMVIKMVIMMRRTKNRIIVVLV